jgi:tetratricopeptide (TPR) repeat protein
VQHAHQKGIIHRDIKPTNVLVAEYDNRAVPKVIDFGVAKAVAQKLTERTMFTEFGQVLGTFEYMSPEQAKLNQLDIDTRSDIYSLGVLLYELLTGSTPFERTRLQEAAFDEMLRIIREEEPPKPSTKLSSSDTLPSIASNRHTEPARLTKDVRGDLDWIVMKSLDKDRGRRYESASSLAHDLERYLSDLPVQAGPPSLGYRLRKYVKRNKRGVAIATVLGVVILAAIGGTAGSIGWNIRDRRALQAVIDSKIESLLDAAELALDQGEISRASDSLQHATAVMATTQALPAFQTRVDEGYAKMRQMSDELDVANLAISGSLYEQLPVAEAKLRQAVRKLPQKSLSHALLGRNLALQGKPTEAEYYAREGVRLNPNEAWAHYCLAFVLVRQERFAEAIEHYRADLELQRDPPEYSHKFDDAVTHYRLEYQPHSDRAQSRIELAWALRRAGRAAEAELEFQKARQDADFSSPTYAGDYFARQGRLQEAANHYLEATRVNPDDSDLALRAACLSLATGDREQYRALCQQMLDRFGQTDDSRAAGNVCIACLLSPEPVGDLEVLRRLSNRGDGYPPQLVYRARALAAFRTGDWEEALRSSQLSRRHAQESPFHVLQNHVLEAIALHHLDRTDEARQAYGEATKVARELFPRAPFYLGVSHWSGREWIEWAMFEPLRREAEALVPKTAATSVLERSHGSADGVRRAISEARSLSWDKLDARDLLVCGELLLLGGDFEKAAEVIAEAIGRGGKGASYYKSLGWALLRAGKRDEATAALSTALEGLDRDQLIAEGDPDHWTAAYLLGRVEEADFVKHWQNHPQHAWRYVPLPWFYVGQKMEADGKLQQAVSAYRRSVERGAVSNPDHDLFYLEYWTGTVDDLLIAGTAANAHASAAWAAYRLTELIGQPRSATTQPAPTSAQATRLRRYDEAVAPYERKIDLNPDHPTGYQELAQLLALARAPEEHSSRAVELATRGVELDAQNARSWQVLGWAQYRQGNWQACIDAMEKSCQLQDQWPDYGPGDSYQWFFQAMAHKQLGHTDEARSWFDQAVEWMVKNEPHNGELHRFRAEATLVLGIRATGDALSQLTAMLLDRGSAHVFAGRWEMAAADISQAVTADPNHEDAAFSLAIALLKAGREAEYRSHCHAFLERAVASGQFTAADKAAKAALLLPVVGADFDRACELADFAATATEPDWLVPWLTVVKSLAEYRRGRFDSANEWAQRATSAVDAPAERKAGAWIVQAMAAARLQKPDMARTVLAKANALINDHGARNDQAWRDWVIAEHLRDEAAEVVGVTPTTSDVAH